MPAEGFLQKENVRTILYKILVVIAAVMLYGVIAGIRADTSLLVTLISDNTGFTYGEVSSAFAVLNIVFAFSIPVVAFLTLKIRRTFIMIAGAMLCAVGFFGTAFVHTYPGIVIFIGILFGLGASFLSFTVVYSGAKQFFGEKGASILSGILLASQGAFGMVESPVISTITDAFSINACLFLIALVALCMIPLALLFLRRKNTTIEVKKKDNKNTPSVLMILKALVVHPFFYLLLLGSLVFGLGDGGQMNHLAQYVEDVFYTRDFSSAAVSIYSISVMSGAFVGGFIGAKIKNKSVGYGVVLIIWAIVNALCTIMLNHQAFGLDITVMALSITFAIGFIINVGNPILVGCATEHVTPAVCAVLLSIYEFGAFVAYSIDSFVGGIFHDIFGGFEVFDTIIWGVAVLAAVLFIIYGIRTRNKENKEII